MSKSKFLIIPLLIAMVFILSACQEFPKFNVVRGSGILITEDRPVSGFTAIQLDGAGRLFIVQGDSESLKIRADDNLMANLDALEEARAMAPQALRELNWANVYTRADLGVRALVRPGLAQRGAGGGGGGRRHGRGGSCSRQRSGLHRATSCSSSGR